MNARNAGNSVFALANRAVSRGDAGLSVRTSTGAATDPVRRLPGTIRNARDSVGGLAAER